MTCCFYVPVQASGLSYCSIVPVLSRVRAGTVWSYVVNICCQQEGGALQFERHDLVNMLHSASQALVGTSFVILFISSDKGMIW